MKVTIEGCAQDYFMLYLYILKCQHLFLGFSSFTIPIPDRLKG